MKGITLRLALMGAHTGYHAGTDGRSSIQALSRAGTQEANPRGVWGAVVLDGVAFGSADYLTGKIRNKGVRVAARAVVRGGSLWLGYELMKHNQKQGR